MLSDLLAFAAFAGIGIGAIGLVAGLVEWIDARAGRRSGR